MSAATLYDAGAPTLEVRIYDHDRLLARELCESEEDAATVVERWSDVANLFVVADHLSTNHEPDDILAPDEPLIGSDEDYPIASTPVPGCGTE
jgi:hypothetical protein